MELIKRKQKVNWVFWIVLALVLISCIITGSVLAWLTYHTYRYTQDNLTLGVVDFEVYSGDTRLTTIKHDRTSGVRIEAANAFEVTGSTTIRDVNLTIRNTGTINAIIRLTLSIYRIDAWGNRVALILSENPTNDNMISINNSGWVNDFKDGVTSGYTYYNEQITPYTIRRNVVNTDGTTSVESQIVSSAEVPVVSQLLVPETMANETYYISLIVDGVAWAGNMYQENFDRDRGESYQIPTEAYPFGRPETLPENWTAWKRTTNFYYF